MSSDGQAIRSAQQNERVNDSVSQLFGKNQRRASNSIMGEVNKERIQAAPIPDAAHDGLGKASAMSMNMARQEEPSSEKQILAALNLNQNQKNVAAQADKNFAAMMEGNGRPKQQETQVAANPHVQHDTTQQPTEKKKV